MNKPAETVERNASRKKLRRGMVMNFSSPGLRMVGPRMSNLDGPHDVTVYSLYLVVTWCQEKSGAEFIKSYWPIQYAQFGGKKV